jgi:hypothetical protein
MPGFLLHQGAVVLCMHGGQAQPTAPDPRVQVSGQPITTQPPPYAVAGCPLNTPCVTAQWVTAATRVRSNGMPVLLQDSVAACAPTGTGLQVVQTQMRAKAT